MPGDLVTIQEACELLGVSRPTFEKIRKDRNLHRFFVGKRPRFLRQEILDLVSPSSPISTSAIFNRKLNLSIASSASVRELEVEPNVFDLRQIGEFDPWGVLDLFCTIAHAASSGRKIRLLVEDNFVCNHLRSLGFFLELEKLRLPNLVWSREVMMTSYEDVTYPVGLTNITIRKQEAPVVEKIIKLLRSQGFSDGIGGYIGWILGELVDNAMTHLVYSGAVSSCYMLARRFRVPSVKADLLIVGVADLGPGIHATLKKNPKHQELTDEQAFLSAFKPKVSSWGDEYDRGKGLTDILTIAMGNRSMLRAESGTMRLRADFRENREHTFERIADGPPGTRFALVLIDRDFELTSKGEASEFIDGMLAKL